MKSEFYPSKEPMKSTLAAFIQSPHKVRLPLSIDSETDFKIFQLKLSAILTSEHRFGIDVKDIDDVEINVESKNGYQLVFQTDLAAIFCAFANNICMQFDPEKE